MKIISIEDKKHITVEQDTKNTNYGWTSQ